MVDGQLSAVILLPDGSLWSIQPVSEVALGTPPSWHVVYDFTDVRPGLGICGNDDLMEVNAVQTDSSAPGEEGEDESTPPEGGPGAQVGERVADIAFDADVEFFRLNGSSVNLTLFDIERVANAVNVIYRRDVRIDHWISAIIVRTREQDPYNQTNSSALLCQFRTWWNANHRGISRDTAHLMTGKNLDGNIIGVAWTGVICNVEGRGRLCNVDANLAYGLSQSTSSNFARRVALTAHEVGHNWNAGHCDGDNDCNIMCATIGGCSGNLTSFGTRSRNSIAAHRNSRDCLFTCKAVANVPGDSNRVIGGAHAVCWGGRVAISAGSYPEVWHLNKKVTLTSKGGLVRIGK